MGWLADERGLEKTGANYVPLTPLSHLRRAAQVFADETAVIYGTHKVNYREYAARVTRLASALAQTGVTSGDVVATVLPNVTAQIEASFGVPACGAILNTINIRLDVDTISYILKHGEAKVVLVDTQFLETVEAAIKALAHPQPTLIECPDAAAGFPATGRYQTYDDLLTSGRDDFEWIMPQDEWESLSLNYTSGTTGRPKGVVYHHRGAYLMTMGTVISWRMVLRPIYLAIVPLFHCNGWHHTWMMPLLGGTLIGCRDVTAENIYDAIRQHKVTHFGGAPIVLNIIINAPEAVRCPFKHTIEVFTAGAPPAPATLAAIELLGFNVMQVYGLTETFGHVGECLWHERLNALPKDAQAQFKARQGIAFPVMEHITVVDENAQQIAMDGKTTGEIVMRGNCVMKGYYKNAKATEQAFRDAYFHSEDIAVQHPDGMMQITDRMKDIIISGGENISSVEVEGILMAHPAVNLCAVVAKPDDKWGEVPCAFVELIEGQTAAAQELIEHTRAHLAGFKCPKQIVFQDLPKTATGKIQKFQLRQQAKTM